VSEERVTTEQRRLVIARAKRCCEYCASQVQFATQSFSVEHIVPRQRSGDTKSENLALFCQGCNGHKYTKTESVDPVKKQQAPLFNPRQQSWKDHFVWTADFTKMLGLTATGRATVETLNLNRLGLVNLRRALFAFGQHPPEGFSARSDS
jgi:HNH endonuclease